MAPRDSFDTIPTTPPEPVAQNFSKLLEVGIATAQQLSQDHWTDFNEHDPGVTILEALSYALTDLSYRINHPIADIIASSMAETDTPLDQQPLFPGDRALTMSPYTEADFRKLAYDRVRGLRDLWLRPVDNGREGLHRVLLQAYPDLNGNVPDETQDRLREEVNALLCAYRPFGEDFLYPEMAPRQAISLSTEITIAAEASADSVLADMLFRIGHKINPAPELREVKRDLATGTLPDEIFNGPRLDLGWVPTDSLPDYALAPRRDVIADTILETPLTQALGRLSISQRLVHPDISGIAQITVLDRTEAAFRNITVIRDGVVQTIDRKRVLLKLNHKEESARWDAGYASHLTSDLDYAKVPLGGAKRQLARYRSLQHLMPPAYRLGHEDAPPLISKTLTVKGDAAEPYALRMQLKAYLLFFEQFLTNALAQLSHLSPLFSFQPDQHQTYFSQPLCPAEGDTPLSPPDIAPVLGADHDLAWWTHYRKRLDDLAGASDPVAQRLNTVRSALLARFGTQIPERRLRQLCKDKHTSHAAFDTTLAAQKRDYLAQVIAHDSQRSVGINPMQAAPPQLIRTIRDLTRHDGPLEVLDHVLLRPNPGLLPLGVGKMEINKTFVVSPSPQFHAFRLFSRTQSCHLIATNSLFAPEVGPLLSRFLAATETAENIQLSRAGHYTTHLSILEYGKPLFFVREAFETRGAAMQMRDWILQRAADLRAKRVFPEEVATEVLMPAPFFDRRATIVLADPHPMDDRAEYHAFVSATLRQRLPAHLRQNVYWTTPDDGALIHNDARKWATALRAARSTQSPDNRQLWDLEAQSALLRNHIQRLCVQDLVQRRMNNNALPPA